MSSTNLVHRYLGWKWIFETFLSTAFVFFDFKSYSPTVTLMFSSESCPDPLKSETNEFKFTQGPRRGGKKFGSKGRKVDWWVQTCTYNAPLWRPSVYSRSFLHKNVLPVFWWTRPREIPRAPRFHPQRFYFLSSIADRTERPPLLTHK